MAEKRDIPVSEQIQMEIDKRKMAIRSKKHLTLVWVHPIRRVISFGNVGQNGTK